MEELCARCARLSLRRSSIKPIKTNIIAFRSFSSSVKLSEADGKPQSGPPAGQKLLRATRPPRSSSTNRPFVPRQPSATLNARSSPDQGASGGRLLQRSRPRRSGQSRSRGDDDQLVRVKYADGSEAEVPRKQLLQPGRGFKTPEYVLDTQAEKAEEQDDSENGAQDGEEVEPTDADIDQYIEKYVDRPANPTEPIPYTPVPQSHLELQKDWPDTPLSSAGLTATVVQRIEFLAQRIPHGYQTPEQIAEHFRQGNLTKFESEEEKQQVLKMAQELAQKRADQLTERKGETVPPVDMTLSDLNKNNDDKQTLVDTMVRGDFKEPAKQRMPFLDSIVRNLQNNQTYHKPEMDHFMAKINSLIPAQAGNRRPAPKPAQK